jgi:hypothetical protein
MASTTGIHVNTTMSKIDNKYGEFLSLKGGSQDIPIVAAKE